MVSCLLSKYSAYTYSQETEGLRYGDQTSWKTQSGVLRTKLSKGRPLAETRDYIGSAALRSLLLNGPLFPVYRSMQSVHQSVVYTHTATHTLTRTSANLIIQHASRNGNKSNNKAQEQLQTWQQRKPARAAPPASSAPFDQQVPTKAKSQLSQQQRREVGVSFWALVQVLVSDSDSSAFPFLRFVVKQIYARLV